MDEQIKIIWIIFLSVSIFGLLLFVYVKNQIRKRILDVNGYLTVIKSTENVKSSAEIFTIDPIKFKISQNLKKSFDPKRIFNPGKMYTGV